MTVHYKGVKNCKRWEQLRRYGGLVSPGALITWHPQAFGWVTPRPEAALGLGVPRCTGYDAFSDLLCVYHPRYAVLVDNQGIFNTIGVVSGPIGSLAQSEFSCLAGVIELHPTHCARRARMLVDLGCSSLLDRVVTLGGLCR